MDNELDFASRTPSQLVECYVAENILRPDSIRNYHLAAHVFEKDTGIRQISDINRDRVLKWRDIVLERVKPTTWNNYRLHLSVMWNFEVRRHWVEINPFADVRPAPVLKKVKKTIPNDLLTATMELLRNADKAPKPAWFWLIAVRFLYFTGIRRRQLTSLKWKDIDFNENIIVLRAEGCKTKRDWTIPIPATCLSDLRRLQTRTEAVYGRSVKPEDQVFRVQLFYNRYKGCELSSDQIGGFFGRLSKDLTGPVSSHRLRHTMATELAKGPNRNLKLLQQILGHTNLSTTLEYVHPDPEQFRGFLNQLQLPEKRGN